MPFVLKKSNTFKWPITVEMSVDGGTWERMTFDIEYKDLTQSRIREIAELSEEGTLSEIDLAKEMMVGWAGVVDEEGNEIPFSMAGRDEMLEFPMLAGEIVKTYMEAKQGAKRKN
tara:strand:+ start:743 stop:1087 length:345 start_codon:yes stop_codon:yes gene_type:complete